MALPASGALTFAQVRTELGGSGAVVVPSTEVRSLTGVASGPIVFPADFYNKSLVKPSSSPSAVSESGAGLLTRTLTLSATGGTSPYTWNCTWQSGGTGITLVNGNTASPQLSSNPLPAESRTGTLRCTATDAAGLSGFVDVNVTFSE